MRTALLALVLALAGCTDPPRPPAGTPASSAQPANLAVVSKGDPNGEQACVEIRRTNALHPMTDPNLATLGAVAYAGTLSTTPDIAARARELDAAVKAATAGPSGDWQLRLAAGTAAVNLETACTTSGYYPKP